MSSAEDQQDYNTISSQYDSIESLPHSLISQALVRHALEPIASNAQILDLGGGSGLHARTAIALNATHISNIDISPSMLQNCSALEVHAGRKPGEKISVYQGDAAGPTLPVGTATYDITLMIWTFDHATTPAELHAMWSNVSRHTKPGGHIISIRSTDPRVRPAGLSKYGVTLSEIEDVPQGPAVKYKFTVGFEKPFEAVATNLVANFDLEQARAMAREHGFDGLEVVDARELEIVKKDPEFWKEYVKHPGFICVVGRKL